jgi:hypothetical protein
MYEVRWNRSELIWSGPHARGSRMINTLIDLEGTPVSVIVEDGVRIARAILHDHETPPGLGAAGIPDAPPVTRAPQG